MPLLNRDAIDDIDIGHVKRGSLQVPKARTGSLSEKEAPAPPRGDERVGRSRIDSDDTGFGAAPLSQAEVLKPPLPPAKATPAISLELMQESRDCGSLTLFGFGVVTRMSS